MIKLAVATWLPIECDRRRLSDLLLQVVGVMRGRDENRLISFTMSDETEPNEWTIVFSVRYPMRKYHLKKLAAAVENEITGLLKEIVYPATGG